MNVSLLSSLVANVRVEEDCGYVSKRTLIDLAMKKGNWTEEDAKQLFDKQKDEGKIIKDPDGFWRWV